MRLQGENWENRIYPMLSTPQARWARSLLPERTITGLASEWLRHGRSILSRPYFRAVALAAAEVLPPSRRNRFLSEHLRFIAHFYLQMIDLIEARRVVIKDRLAPRLRMQMSGLEVALASGRGVLMPTIQTAVPLRMIFAGFPAEGRYNLVLHRQHAGIVKMLEKADSNWSFLFLEDAPARHIVNALRRGEVVICNIDHAYPDTEVTLAPVLGHPAIVPSGVFRVAQRYGAAVVPLTFTEEADDIVIAAPRMLTWPEDEAMPVAAMLARLHPLLDRTILDVPEQWLGWGNLLKRWHAWRTHLS